MDVDSWAVPKLVTKIIQRFQNKVPRNIVHASWYIRSSTLHQDLGMETVAKIIKKTAASHEQRLHSYVNVRAIQLFDNAGLKRRFKKNKTIRVGVNV